ncbi:MAG: polysaccharide deacetylase [Lentisphaerae bacterium RIFOXYB12_FULL_65_16]|nr:MAG: polysaccharide deacetylase [Lentisphaerae bacterium RIFOXYA12_64_32]OGV87823.1 MAG: polysaccharide deacetylase [Lentisphaerae bacterium RIFOXYB12_FULL_65_16]
MSETNAFQWPAGKRMAVSLSFDDARISQVDVGIPVLDRHGAKGTFYVAFSRLEERLAGWRAAAAAGHEIANHSLRHACSANFVWGARNVLENYTLEQMESELVEASRQIESLFGVAPRTFAYPCGQDFVGRGLERRSYVPVVAKHFLAGRGFRDEYLNAPTICDLAKVGGTEMDGLDFDGLLGILNRAMDKGFWVVLAGHEVGDRGSQCTRVDALDRLCAYCADPANGIWLDTVANIAAYVKANRSEP